jgi:formate dehydrogenase major subunit
MAANTIEITLDGKKILVEPGKTILEVAESRGIRIPTLCNDPRLEPYASCWVCLVKVERAKGFVPSCGTKVAPGMVITTGSPDVMAARRMAMELLLSNHYGDCKAPCTLTCPSNIDIQGYLGLVANGKHAEALELIRRDNPMPAVIGRICPHPCEEKCRRSLVEEPLAINTIKRFVADAEAATAGLPARPKPARRGKKTAVVGAGPAGLSAAWYLSEQGVDVTLFESMEKAGGMLRYGIPDYRLPPAVLDRSIGELLSLGATLRTGQRMGRDFTLESLREGYDAVVLAFGAWKGRTLRIPGEDHPAVLSGIDFLQDVNGGKPVKVGATVAIVGGGNTALDAARCALRLGAKKVTMYYRRTREEMPASDAEIEEALEEGVDVQYLVAPVSIEAEPARLKGLTLLRMALGEPDASGRRRPVPVDGSEFSVPVDTIISAVGQYADTRLLSGIEGLLDAKGNLAADLDTGKTEIPGVFAAGDLLTGTDIAIRAVAGGKHAARAALAFMDGRVYQRPKEFLSKKGDFREPVAADYVDTARTPRVRPIALSPVVRKKGFAEIESTLSAEQAAVEAARCLECGCRDVKDCALKQQATEYEAVAKRFLGEVAVHPVDDSHPFISRDPSKCILCGRCIRICLETQGIGVFGYMYRGFASVVAPSFGTPFGEDTTCISCGQCVSACPVGALTEKLPAKKNVPLQERVEPGVCGQCSVGCGIELRWHGSLFTRATERYEAPGNGKLCKKGRFGHAFLNDPLPAPLETESAREAVRALLAGARTPVMRISPSLCVEAIEAFADAAKARAIPVEGAGLQGVDSRWSELAATAPGTASGGRELIVLVGDIASSNNVAFTEALRRRKLGADLWILGHDDEVAQRAASRLFPDADAGLKEALASGADVEVWINPEESGNGLLESLRAAGGKARVMLLWHSRNAGYLLTRQSPVTKAPDLVLDVGVDGPKNGTKRILWGRKPEGQDLFIPLSRELWVRGKSYPTGSAGVQNGAVEAEWLAPARLL